MPKLAGVKDVQNACCGLGRYHGMASTDSDGSRNPSMHQRPIEQPPNVMKKIPAEPAGVAAGAHHVLAPPT